MKNDDGRMVDDEKTRRHTLHTLDTQCLESVFGERGAVYGVPVTYTTYLWDTPSIAVRENILGGHHG